MASWRLEPTLDSGSPLLDSQQPNFGTAVRLISDGAYVPERKNYPPFRKLFHEDVVNNPSLQTTNLDYGFEAHYKEQKEYWERNNAGCTFPSQQRFQVFSNSPTKPEEFPFLSYKEEKYWGRERRVHSFSKTRIYSITSDRLHHDVEVFDIYCLTLRSGP